MKNNFKKAISLTLACAMIATASLATTAFAAEAGKPLDPDLVFAPMIDFEGLTTNINYDSSVPGMSEDVYAAEMWKRDAGVYQVKEGIGANKSNGLHIKNKFGDPDGQGSWSAIKMEPTYGEGGVFEKGIYKYDTVGAANNFCFWIDTTGWKTYKVEKEGTEIIKRLSDTPELSIFSIWLAVYDNGTSAGEGLSAYVPTLKSNIMIQDIANGGWIETPIRKDEYFTLPKGYKGYVMIPRESFHTIWGAHGDVIASGDQEKVGDNLFNGPLQFICMEHLAGSLQFEGSEVVFDNFGFVSYEDGFAEGLETIPDLNTYFEPEKPEFVKGDATGDGTVNTLDSLQILKHIAEMIKIPDNLMDAADYNSNGKVDTLDSLSILKFLAGIK